MRRILAVGLVLQLLCRFHRQVLILIGAPGLARIENCSEIARSASAIVWEG